MGYLMRLNKIFLLLITSLFIFCNISHATPTIEKVFHAPKGTQPSGLAWNGGFLWLSSYAKMPGIYKINTLDGSVVNIYKPKLAMSGRYGGLAADQFSIFHIQANNGWNALELKLSTGDVKREFDFRARVINYSDIAVLNGKIWAIGNNNALAKNDYRLFELDYSGKVLKTFFFRQEDEVVQNHGITSDGTFLWISSGNRMLKISPISGDAVAAFSLPEKRIGSLAWDGESIWAASFYGNIYKISFSQIETSLEEKINNFRQFCTTRTNGCFSIRYTEECDYDCAIKTKEKIEKKLGVEARVSKFFGPLEPSGCIGYRPDIGGTKEMAELVRDTLGNDYYLGKCMSDGFTINVRAKAISN